MSAKPKPMTKTISGRTTSDFIGIPRLRPQDVLVTGCTEGMDAVFAGGVSPRADTLALRAGTSAKFDAYLSLTLSLPRKGGTKFLWHANLGPVRSWDNYSHFLSIVLLSGRSPRPLNINHYPF